MIPVAIVRPEPGAGSTLAAARALGLDAHACPIFAVEPIAWQPVAREDVDAVLLGSANALRHGGAGLEGLRGLPAYCVGETTARAAGAAGFAVAGVGAGGLQQALALLAPAHRRLLRLAGTARVPLALPPAVTMTTREVYATVPLPLDPQLAALLKRPAVVMLHSGEAARHFDALCAKGRVARAQVGLAVIGPRVARLAGEGWAAVACAAQADDAALLALAARMCQDLGPSAASSPERPDAGR